MTNENAMSGITDTGVKTPDLIKSAFAHKVNGLWYLSIHASPESITLEQYKAHVRTAYGSLSGVEFAELGVDYAGFEFAYPGGPLAPVLITKETGQAGVEESAWTQEHDEAAAREGWNIFEASGNEYGPWLLQRLDEVGDFGDPGESGIPQLKSDAAAYAIVANGVEPHHRAALEFLKTHNAREYRIARAFEGLKLQDPRPLSELYQLWDRLSDTPESATGVLLTAFESFPAGTAKSDVWYWLESQNERFTVADAMIGIRRTDGPGVTLSKSGHAGYLALAAHSKALGIEGDDLCQVTHLLISLRHFCSENGVDFLEALTDSEGISTENAGSRIETLASEIEASEDPNVLDDVIHDECSALATGVNNEGVRAQLNHLEANGWTEEMIRKEIGLIRC